MTYRIQFGSSLLVAVFVALAVLATGSGAQQKESGQAVLRAAIDKETIDGNIRAAISEYRAIAARFAQSDRAVAAQALLHLAQAQQKLGDADAERVYRGLLRQYPEQTQAIAAARANLATFRSPAARAASGAVCTDCVGPYEKSFTISPDGRWFGYTNADNELMARNLVSGEVKRLVGFPSDSYATARLRARHAVWSRDGRTVAFYYRDVNAAGPFKDRGYLRLLTLGSADEPKTLVDNPDLIYVLPAAWSLDGKAILVSIQRRDFTWELAWVSAETGATTQLRSLQWDFNEFRNGPELSPDGRYIAYATFAAAVTPPPTGGTMPSIITPEARAIHVLASDGSRDTVVARSERGWPSPIWRADGGAVLFVSQRDQSGIRDLWAVDVRNGTPAGGARVLKTSLGTDPQLVGTTRAGALYYVLPASQTERVFIADTGSPETSSKLETTLGFTGASPTWSPDGKQLAWIGWEKGSALNVFSEEAGRAKTYQLPQGAVVAAPVWEFDSEAVVVGIRNRDTGRGFALTRVDLASSEVRMIGRYAPTEGETWSPEFALAPNGTMLVMSTMAKGGNRSLIGIDLRSGERRVVLTDLTTVLRAAAVEDAPVARVIKTAWHPVPVLGTSVAADGRIAVITATGGETSLTQFASDGTNTHTLYGPTRLRSREQALVSPLGDPKWLAADSGIALGVQQDDFSWKLIRVLKDGRVEPLNTGTQAMTLPPDTLAFDLAPDGRRVAYERMVTFSGELAVLVLPQSAKTTAR
jgi:Tol biopolymer transport system component